MDGFLSTTKNNPLFDTPLTSNTAQLMVHILLVFHNDSFKSYKKSIKI